MTPNDTLGRLLGDLPALGDGGIATALQAAGLGVGEPPEAWCGTAPERVRAVHAAFAAAGARWSTANSFGADPATAARAVRLAREGAPGLPVFGSLGPAAGRAEVAAALAAAGAEGALVETITSLPAGVAAVRACAGAGFAVVIASFTPAETGGLLDGVAPETAAEAFLEAGATVVGANCGRGPASVLPVVRRLVALGAAPVYAAPSAGLPLPGGGAPRYALTPAGFAAAAAALWEAGALLVGGCCGVGPAHIRAAAGRRGGPRGARQAAAR